MRWRTRQPPVVRLRCRCRRFLCHAQHLIVDGFCQPRGVSSGRTNTTLYSRLYQNSMTARITAWPMISSDLIRSTFGTKPIMSGSPYRRASANDGSARRPSRRPRPRRCSRNPPLPKPERCPRGAYRIAPGLRSSRNGWVAVQSSRTYPSVPVTRFPDLRAPFGSHASAGMDVDVPSPSGAGVDELVRRAGRGDYDLPARRLDGGVSYREGKLALLHHEDLLVRVSVQLWALSGRRLRQEERDIHVAVEETLKPVYGPVVRKFAVADYAGHVLILFSCNARTSTRVPAIALRTSARAATDPGPGDAADQQPREPPRRDEPPRGLPDEVERREQARGRRDQPGDRHRPGQLACAQPGQREHTGQHTEADAVYRSTCHKGPPRQRGGAVIVLPPAAAERQGA